MATVSVLAVLKAKSFLRFGRFLPNLVNNHCKQSVKNSNILPYCSTSENVPKTTDLSDTNVSESAKKAEDIKITLLLPDNSMLITDLQNANKISKRRGLILFKIQNVQKKTNRPTYKLINQMEHLKQELNNDESENENPFKNVKTIQISPKITTHDLLTKLKNINKLLDKKYKVKIILAHGSSTQDNIIKSIETNVNDHGTIQRVVKQTSTTFTVTPNLKENDNDNSQNVNVKKQKKGAFNSKSV